LSNLKEGTQMIDSSIHEYLVLEYKGLKIGFLGLAADDYTGTFNDSVTEDIVYEPYTDCCARLIPVLKKEKGCDLVIAITHMRVPDEKLLA
jgi:5'-nucleotidase